MANDTPRYGSRNDDSARRYADDSNATDERPTRRSYFDSLEPDEQDGADPPRSSPDTYARRREEGTSKLDGLRPSRYEADESASAAREPPVSPRSRDNGALRSGSAFEPDKFKAGSSPSSLGATDAPSRNPLLRSESAVRRFSWEDEEPKRPASRPSPPARDYEPPRYEPRNPRLDDMAPSRRDVLPASNHGADDRQDRAPAYGSRPAAPSAAPERGYRYEDTQVVADTYQHGEPQADYEPYDHAAYQGAHSRELADVDQDYAREYHYNAESADLRHGYGDYDPDYQHFDREYGEYQEETRRRGPFLLLGSLVGVAVIAGGLIFAWQALRGGEQEVIPVVTVDEAPVKVEPQAPPSVQDAPRKSKLIYDRIRSEDTESESTLVPREEQPEAPGDRDQTNNDPTPRNDQVTVNPTSESSPTDTDTDADGPEPLPLPLPPPPVNNAENSQSVQPTFNTTTQNLNTGGEVIVPAQGQTDEPPAPASDDIALRTDADQNDTDASTELSSSVNQLIQSPPLPREKPTPPSRQAAPGPAVPTGPIQIAPLPGSVDRSPDDATSDQAEPQATPQAPAQESPRRRSSRFSEELSSNSTTTSLTDTRVALAPTPDAQVQEVPQETAPITGGRYIIQLAAYSSEQEAQTEFQKLQGRHPDLLGSYGLLIQQANLGASGTYYRLRVGPIEKRSRASQLCTSLIAAGERDCLVRER